MSNKPKQRVVVCGDLEQPVQINLNVGECVYYAHSSPDKTTGNEDSIGVIEVTDNVAALIVADGLGGYRAGDEASQTAINTLFEALEDYQEKDSIRATMMSGLENSNVQVMGVGGGAATTFIGAILIDDSIRIYHVGDSGGIVVGQRGALKQRTIAHSPVGLAEASGLLDEEMALVHESRHIVSNVLGSAQMRIEVGPRVTLARYDTLLLASDGLLDNLRMAEIVEKIRKGKLMHVANMLREVVAERMHEPNDGHPSKPDDLSFILFRRTR